MAARKWVVVFGSERQTSRWARRKARQLLRRGIEPEKRPRTGKFWTD